MTDGRFQGVEITDTTISPQPSLHRLPLNARKKRHSRSNKTTIMKKDEEQLETMLYGAQQWHKTP